MENSRGKIKVNLTQEGEKRKRRDIKRLRVKCNYVNVLDEDGNVKQIRKYTIQAKRTTGASEYPKPVHIKPSDFRGKNSKNKKKEIVFWGCT